jgi:hypothetical protein
MPELIDVYPHNVSVDPWWKVIGDGSIRLCLPQALDQSPLFPRNSVGYDSKYQPVHTFVRCGS